MKEYELTVLLRPNLSKEEAEATVLSIKGEITQRGGELTDETSRGMLRLAYIITTAGNKYQEGNHQLLRFVVSPDQIMGIESELNLSEDILRFKIVRYQEMPIPGKTAKSSRDSTLQAAVDRGEPKAAVDRGEPKAEADEIGSTSGKSAKKGL